MLAKACARRSLFATRARMLHGPRYRRAHVVLYTLHACSTSFSLRYSRAQLHCLRFTRAHVVPSSLHARACYTVLATRMRICTVFVTSARMVHCLHYTRAHVALSLLHVRPCALSSLHARACCTFYAARPRCISTCLSLLCNLKNAHFTFPFFCTGYKPLEILVLFMPKNVFLPPGLSCSKGG